MVTGRHVSSWPPGCVRRWFNKCFIYQILVKKKTYIIIVLLQTCVTQFYFGSCAVAIILGFRIARGSFLRQKRLYILLIEAGRIWHCTLRCLCQCIFILICSNLMGEFPITESPCPKHAHESQVLGGLSSSPGDLSLAEKSKILSVLRHGGGEATVIVFGGPLPIGPHGDRVAGLRPLLCVFLNYGCWSCFFWLA